MNSLESGSNVQSGLEMIMEKSPDTIVLVDRNLTLVKVISAKDDYYHYLANNCISLLRSLLRERTIIIYRKQAFLMRSL